MNRVYFLLLLALGATVVAMALSCCGTVSPNLPVSHGISFGSDGLRDAGVKGEVVDTRTGAKMILKTEADRAEFNRDVLKYGILFNPPLTQDEGLISYHGLVAFRNDVLVDFVAMREWAKEDAARNAP